jgi:Fic family protein
MDSWMRMEGQLAKTEKMDPVVAAAAAAFGFVFIHPFEDGNGRIHRFLVHHILAKLGYAPNGLLFPVSAAMLRNRAAYDRVLEQYSVSIFPFINFQVDSDGGMTVRNATAHLYRFFDATAQAEYLYRCIQETIRKDLREEIGFLAVFDGAVRRVLHIVDMPDRRASLLVRLIFQNKGKLSNSKRALFAEVSEDELHNIERAVWQTWEEEHAKTGPAHEG